MASFIEISENLTNAFFQLVESLPPQSVNVGCPCFHMVNLAISNFRGIRQFV